MSAAPRTALSDELPHSSPHQWAAFYFWETFNKSGLFVFRCHFSDKYIILWWGALQIVHHVQLSVDVVGDANGNSGPNDESRQARRRRDV